MPSTTTRPNRSSGRGEAPFLSIVTRHLTTRTELLERLVSSIKSQTDADLEHIILTDDEGRGLGWANQQFERHKDLPEGRYVMMLDDDDWLVPKFSLSSDVTPQRWNIPLPSFTLITVVQMWATCRQRK